MPVRARTPEQKRQVIETLYNAWLALPDMRLGQLLTNAANDAHWTGGTDLFHWEDGDLAAAVVMYLFDRASYDTTGTLVVDKE